MRIPGGGLFVENSYWRPRSPPNLGGITLGCERTGGDTARARGQPVAAQLVNMIVGGKAWGTKNYSMFRSGSHASKPIEVITMFSRDLSTSRTPMALHICLAESPNDTYPV